MSELASDTAMILAAGLGKRMRPLTASQPKPMVRVAGKPLIDHALDRLSSAGVTKAVVNVHYLADALEAHLVGRTSPVITISDERESRVEENAEKAEATSVALIIGGMTADHDEALGDETFDLAGVAGRRDLLLVAWCRFECEAGKR